MAFPFLPILGGALGLGILASRPSTTGTVKGTLKPYQWYRILLKTPPMSVPSRTVPSTSSRRLVDLYGIPLDIITRTKALGFDDPLFAFGDAKTGEFWDIYAKFLGGGPPKLSEAGVLGAYEVLDVNPIAPDFPVLDWRGPAIRRPDPTADGPMDPKLLDAVAFASTHDTDVRRLLTFATYLLPEFPSASSVVRSRADALVVARADRFSIEPLLALRRIRAANSQNALVGSFLGDFLLGALTGGASVVIPATIAFIEDAVDLIADIGREILEIIKTAAPFIQIGLSFIPGIGTVASAALGAGIALAEGRPITDALIAAAKGAFPGGPLVVDAIETGIRTLVNVAQGDRIDVALLDASRGTIESRFGKAAVAAFDTTVALAQGKKIQDAAIAGVNSISQEAGLVLDAISNGRPIDASLLAQAAAARAGLSPEAQAALSSVTSLAQQGNISQAAANAARSRLPPQAQTSFDAALALAQKRDPRQAILEGSRQLVPDTQEAKASLAMTGAALRGFASPATLTGEAAKFIPNAPAGIRGTSNPASLTAAEAERISSMGKKAFTHPELYLSNEERRRLEEKTQREALVREVEYEQERYKQAVFSARPEIVILNGYKRRAEEARVAAYRASIEEAAIVHRISQESYIPFYAEMKRRYNRGGFP